MPLSASWSSTIDELAAQEPRLDARVPRKRSKYGRTVGSRSIAMKRPSPFRSRGEERGVAAGAEGGVDDGVSGLDREELAHLLGEDGDVISLVGLQGVRQHLRAPFDLVQLLAPGGAIPDLQVVPHSGDDDVPAELSVLDESGRNHHAPLLVELGLGRAEKKNRCMRRRLLAERVELGEPRLDERVPVVLAVGVEAPVHAAREHDALGERCAKPGRQREPVLVVDGVLVFAEKHVWGTTAISTLPHFKPLCPTAQALRTTLLPVTSRLWPAPAGSASCAARARSTSAATSSSARAAA